MRFICSALGYGVTGTGVTETGCAIPYLIVRELKHRAREARHHNTGARPRRRATLQDIAMRITSP